MTAAAEQFIRDYVARHANDRGEVACRKCISAGERHGFTERALVKARFRARDRIGTRKGGPRAGWQWSLEKGVVHDADE